MTSVASATRTAGPGALALARRPRRDWAWIGLVPFAAYVLIFLALPTVLAIGSGFFTKKGAFTLDNIAALGDPVILATFWNSTWVSVLTALVGAIVGALACYAMLGLSESGVVRTSVNAVSGTFAQFGGVTLAFAMIATIGLQGVVTKFLATTFGIDLYAGGAWIYGLPGLIPAYLYFQIPLMVITFLPALEGLRPQWLEATATLGGSRWTYWLRVGGPILLPSFLGSLLLLFANAFSSYATAAALVGQANNIVSLQIRQALISETVLGRSNLAGAMALGMLIVMVVVMLAYSALVRRTARWQR